MIYPVVLMLAITASTAWSLPPRAKEIARSCAFVFNDSVRVHPIPREREILFSLSTPQPGDLDITLFHAFGRTQHIVEKRALRLRECEKSGTVRQELLVTSDGQVSFTHFAKRYRNLDFLSPQVAQQAIDLLRTKVQQGDTELTFASMHVFRLLTRHIPRLVELRYSSTTWPRQARQRTPLHLIQKIVGRQFKYANGLIRLIFFPGGQKVIWENHNTGERLQETITLCKDGEIRRKRGSQELIAHMSDSVAKGLIAYSFYHATGSHVSFRTALHRFREFVFAETPELFAEELPGRSGNSMLLEGADGELFSIFYHSTPTPFNPRLGFEQ